MSKNFQEHQMGEQRSESQDRGMIAMRKLIPIAATCDFSKLPIAEVESFWRQHLREKVPEHLPKSLLSRLLAYRLQELQHGGLSKRAIAYLKVIESDLRNGQVVETPYINDQKLKAGCQMIREHEGVDHRVTVVEGGYEWNGIIFGSLSSVAKAITGTNWNGHRFFGLKAKAQPSAEVTV